MDKAVLFFLLLCILGTLGIVIVFCSDRKRRPRIKSDKSKFNIIEATQDLVHNGIGDPENLPLMLREIIQKGDWRFREKNKHEYKQFFSFKDFVEGSLPFGLQMDWEEIEKLANGNPSFQADIANVLLNPDYSGNS